MNVSHFLRRLASVLAFSTVLLFAPTAILAAEHAAEPAAAAHGTPPAAAAAAPAHAPDHAAAATPAPTVLQMFAYSYLCAFLFCLSLALGGLFSVVAEVVAKDNLLGNWFAGRTHGATQGA